MQKSGLSPAYTVSALHSYWSISHAHSPVSLAPNQCLHSLCVCQRSTYSFLSLTDTSPKQTPPPVHNDSISSLHAPKDNKTNPTNMPPKGSTAKGPTGAEEDVKFLLTIIKQLEGTVSTLSFPSCAQEALYARVQFTAAPRRKFDSAQAKAKACVMVA